jgi:hypothetical protein
MADFSNTEKINAGFKHLFDLQGTSNVAPAAGGKYWYEEKLATSHIIYPEDIWSDSASIPYANTVTQARAASPDYVEDRSQGEAVTLVANGPNWDISTTTIVPKVGLQLTDVHPAPNYIKSITNVVDNGGGSYTITLNNNTGVLPGSAVLQGRIFLTEDPTSNGLSWFAREQQGNHFSDQIRNIIPNSKFGPGFAIRLFQADGTEVFTTHGAWIPNWKQGLILFGDGYTPTDLGYAKPLYMEAFRYVGAFGGGEAIQEGNLYDTLYFNGSDYVPTGTLQSDGTDVNVLNRLTVSGSIVVPSGIIPASSAAPGDEGELRWDSRFLYIHVGSHWARMDLRKF